MMKMTTRILSALLSIAMLICMMPQSVLAQVGESLAEDEPETVVETVAQTPISNELEYDLSDVTVLGEVVDRRTPTSKSFRMSDGSYLLANYGRQIHFSGENGSLQDYDNTLSYSESADADDFDGYINCKSDISIKLANNSNSNNLLKIKSGEYKVSFHLVGANKSKALEIYGESATSEVEDIGAASALNKFSSGAIYKDILPSTDLEYIISGSSVKENIIVKEKGESYVYTFELKLKGLVPVLLENGDVALNCEESGETELVIPKGVMYDAEGKYSDAVEYSIVHENGKKYTLNVTADSEWINADDRVFPVTVDPAIYEGKYRTNEATDAFVKQKDPTATSKDHQFMLSGYAGSDGTMEIYVKSELPDNLPDSAAIVYATLNLRQVSSVNESWKWYGGNAENVVLAARKVESNWNHASLCWNNKPTNSGTILDYNTVSRQTQNKMFYWDITSAVQEWYTDGENYGIVVSEAEPYDSTNGNGVYAHAGFYSIDNPYLYSETPMFMILYRDTKGLESQWTYSSQSADGAGTGYVNGYNGNLVFVHNDMTTEGSVMPLSVNHVYNSFQAGREFTSGTDINSPITADYTNMKVGKGWKLSVQQTIVTRIINNTTYYVYNDEDGTERYFRADSGTGGDGKIKDEDGYGLVLTVNTNDSSKKYVIENELGTKYTFDSTGKITFITDVNNQQKIFEYNSNGRLSQIRHNSGNSSRIELSFGYNSAGALTTLTNCYNISDYVSFKYSETPNGTVSFDNSGYLRQITYSNVNALKTIYYEYNSDGTLSSAKDGDTQYTLTYSYGNHYGRQCVLQVQEKVSSSVGQTIGFEYGDNLFKVRTSGSDDIYNNNDDIKSITLFDNFGHATCSYSTDVSEREIYGASYAKYAEYEEFAETNHSITASVSKGVTSANYISNGNCESTTNWSGYVSNGYTSAITTAEKLYGSKSLKFSNTQSARGHYRRLQNVTIPSEGTYTLSAYVKTVDVDPIYDGGAFIMLDGAESKYITGTTNTAINNGWQRISVTKTFASGGTYPINLKFMGATGTAYFDCVQLEEGSVPSSFNFIQNSSIDSSRGVWNGATYTSVSDFGSCGSLTGVPSSQKRATQEIIVNQPVDTTFMLSGWAKAKSVDLLVGGDNPDETANSTINAKTERKFGLMATLTYSDGSSEDFYEPFNPDNVNRQYISLALASKKRGDSSVPSTLQISKITVSVVYDYNCNTMYFDDICLTAEPAQTYVYTDEGNVEKVTDRNSNTTVADYVNSIDLEKYTAPTGEQFDYEYDDKHQVTSASKTVGENKQTAAYTYDDYGNVKTVTLTSDRSSLKMTSSASYIEDGNFLSQIVDELGNETNYAYDSLTELLKFVENANSVRTAYTYDFSDRVTKIYIDSDEDCVADSTEAQVSYLYANDQISRITTPATEYTIRYTTYNKIHRIWAGTNRLATYEYAPNNGKLKKLTYGNGDYEEYFYDHLDRLVSVKYNGVEKYSIKIDANDRIYSLTENGNTHYYEYDSLGRLVRAWQETSNGEIILAVENTYDEFGRSSGSTYTLPDTTQEYEITYKEDSNLIEQYTTPAVEIAYTYDAFDRLHTKTHYVNNQFWSTYNYDYVTDANGNTTNLVSMFSFMEPNYSGHNFRYTYDNLSNITSITDGNNVLVSYQYDKLGQLIRENNAEQGYTMLYEYDKAGNIIVKSRHPYTTGTAYIIDGQLMAHSYSTSTWGDLLVSFNGTSITYDTIGNPLNWRNSSSMTWEGRRLASQTLNNGDTLTYVYNSDGIRTQKEFYDDSIGEFYTYEYILDGNRIISETVYMGITRLYTMNYFYDETGVAGFEFEGAEFYYLKNLQGDIIEILSSDGTSVVQYTYDAWGKVISVTGTLKNGIGKYNPFRYRGYYYDTETGLYYLNSRYYDPEICRFINADGIIGTGGLVGYNMFAYCNNNPISYCDPMGTCPHDGVLYTSGNFVGLPTYDATCTLCKAHGSYSLIGKDGQSYDFSNTTYEQDLVEFIAGWEQFSEKVNPDGTIGFGTSIKDNQKIVHQVTGTTNPTSISKAQAYEILIYIVRQHEAHLYSEYFEESICLTLHQKNAIISFSYNLGNPGQIFDILNSGDLYHEWTNTAVHGIINGQKLVLPGLVKRRQAEYQIFVYGIYNSTH